MRINLKGVTNSDLLFLNSIILIMPDGREVTLDREETTWSNRDEKGKISITFETPYIWDGEGQEYDGPTILKAIDDARFFLADIEDDAKDHYYLRVDELSFIDSYGQEHYLEHYKGGECYADYLASKEFLKDKDHFTLYQISNKAKDRHYIIFEDLDRLEEFGYKVDSNNYVPVYMGYYGEETNLEALFSRFNLRRDLDTFRGHSMSVSDVVVVTKAGKDRAYFCDSFGFVEVPQFLERSAA